MSFREKIAWASGLGTAGIYGFYFWRLWQALAAGSANPGVFLGLFVMSVVLLVIVQVVLAVILAIAAPKDAQAPRDEREKAIDGAVAQMTGMVLSVLVLTLALASPVVAAIAPHVAEGPDGVTSAFLMANGILLAVVIAELVRAGGQIFCYRLGLS